MKKSIRNKLRELRKRNNYTQETFAEKLDISRSKVSSWENGKRDMNIKDAIRISKECQVSLDNLLEIKEISADEYVEILNKFIRSKNIDLDFKIKILEDAIKLLKEENLEFFYEKYKMTQNTTKL